jgi:hypothetical protein
VIKTLRKIKYKKLVKQEKLFYRILLKMEKSRQTVELQKIINPGYRLVQNNVFDVVI